MEPILIDGDEAIFDPKFGAATVTVSPGKLTATGTMTFGGKQVCVQGNEASASVRECSYMTPLHSTPGKGTLEISELSADQLASKMTVGGKKALLTSGTFSARFCVQEAAKFLAPPAPPILDTIKEYRGSGQFVSTNTHLRGS